jgi:FkbM family methyltransferase
MITLLKKAVKLLPFDFTLNQKYDTQTRKVLKRYCRLQSNCIDIGCHKGEILDLLLKYAPYGIHFGFEPIPDLYEHLKIKYSNRENCVISNIALSNINGTSTFNYVVSNPAYSGLKKRNYDRPGEMDTTIEVSTNLLDEMLPDGYKVDFMKIDVEGGEFLVLKGAIETLINYHPLLIFEHGLGASDIYGTKPSDIFGLLTSCKYRISTMERWLKNEKEFTLKEFEQQYFDKINYYFIAYS